jgi:hypothetical protein
MLTERINLFQGTRHRCACLEHSPGSWGVTALRSMLSDAESTFWWVICGSQINLYWPSRRAGDEGGSIAERRSLGIIPKGDGHHIIHVQSNLSGSTMANCRHGRIVSCAGYRWKRRWRSACTSKVELPRTGWWVFDMEIADDSSDPTFPRLVALR